MIRTASELLIEAIARDPDDGAAFFALADELQATDEGDGWRWVLWLWERKARPVDPEMEGIISWFTTSSWTRLNGSCFWDNLPVDQNVIPPEVWWPEHELWWHEHGRKTQEFDTTAEAWTALIARCRTAPFVELPT